MATLENFPVADGVKAKLGGPLITWFLRLQGVISALVQGSGFVFSHGNRAIVSDAAGALTESDVTSIELGYLDGATSTIQTQINAKLGATTITALTGTAGGTANDAVVSIPDPADTPITADALRDDIVANVLPVIRDDIDDLRAKVNALITAVGG